MKYKDYYDTLGVPRDADADAIKKAYRRLAREHHPDVSGDPSSAERFKEIGEAYATLKDAEKRAAYDALGRRDPGQEFRPPPGWGFNGSSRDDAGSKGRAGFAAGDDETARYFDDIDLADLFGSMAGRGFGAGPNGAGRAGMPIPGEDFDTPVEISLQDAFHGTTLHLELSVPELGDDGRVRRVARILEVRVPPGTTDGRKLRLRERGGKGVNGGRDGDVYLHIAIRPDALFRVSGRDLYLDLPLAPWEAVLGTEVEIPAPGGPLLLTVPPGTRAGRKLRLAGRGLPSPGGSAGDILAAVRIDVPSPPSEQERALMAELAKVSHFDPRSHFPKESSA